MLPPTTQLPREKPLPVEKAQTRWEKFADGTGTLQYNMTRTDEETGRVVGCDPRGGLCDAPAQWLEVVLVRGRG